MRHVLILTFLLLLMPGFGRAEPPTGGGRTEPHGRTQEERSVTRLTLSGMIALVMAKNQHIESQQAQWGIEQAEAEKARAIFEPDLATSLQLEDTSQRNTVEEAVNRQDSPIYEARNWDFSAEIQGLLPTGARVSFGSNFHRFSNTLTRSVAEEDQEYQMYLGAQFTQPLLKNAGVKTTKAGIFVAEAEAEVAFHEYRQETMRTVGVASEAYWDFYQAQEKLEILAESLRIAEQILEDNRERYKVGKTAETETLEAMVGVVSRRSLQREAQQDHLEAMNRLRTLFALAVANDTAPIEAVEEPAVGKAAPIYRGILEKAFQLHPEYLAALERVERAGIKVSFTENQLWPELDLNASYGLNGVDFSKEGAWEQIREGTFDTWSASLELRIPLQGDREEESEHQKAKLEKKRALLSLKAVEVGLANSIDTAIHKVQSASEQLEFATGVVEIQKRLLDEELSLRGAGKSNSRLVLEREEDYRKAKEVILKNRVSQQKALVELELAGGTILLTNGIEPMKEEK